MEFHLLVFIPPTSTPTKVKWFGITRRGNTHENLNASLRSPLLSDLNGLQGFESQYRSEAPNINIVSKQVNAHDFAW